MKEYSVLELQQGLDEGKWTSSDLVEMYLDRIYNYDQNGPKLNSISEINPDAYFIAKGLDIERKEKGPRSLLHGIPIVVKDNINTCDKMHTTAGSLALSDLYAPYDATIIKKLRDAGAIILGKSNLSEFAYFMSNSKMPSGFSSRSGQVINPYDEKLDPLGSSTGSAVSVAANLIPVSIGTETNGSLMAPATYNSIVSIKPTLGLVSRHGIIPISSNQDTAGPMGRTVEDCAILLDIIYGKDEDDQSTLSNDKTYDFINALKIDLKGMKVGILNYSNVEFGEEEKNILNDTKDKLRSLGIDVIDVITESIEMNNYTSLLYEFKQGLDYYLSTVKGSTKMTSLSDIIKYNKEDPITRMPFGQTILEAAAKTSGTLTEYEYHQARKKVLDQANEINTLLDEFHLDAIISSRRTSHAPIAGNPCIAIPAKPLIDSSPISIIFIGKRFEDEKLIAISNAYEKISNYRIPPKL